MNTVQSIVAILVSCVVGGGALSIFLLFRRSGNSGGNTTGLSGLKTGLFGLPVLPELPPAAQKSSEQREQEAQAAKQNEETKIEESDPAHIVVDSPNAADYRADIATIQSGFSERLRTRLGSILQRIGRGSDASGGNGGS